MRLRELGESRVKPLGDVAALLDRYETRARRSARARAARSRRARRARRPCSSITGGPGVGKTTIVRAILALFDDARIPVRLAAPTGRAAKRMSEATGRDAQTLHRLLEFDPKRADVPARRVAADRGGRRDRRRGVDARSAARRLARAGGRAGDAARLVGDVDQLPSVGPGAVLRDVIASGVAPCVRLTQIFRQAAASLIVENAHRINAGVAAETAREPDADFFVVERRDPSAARDTILELVRERIPQRFGLDPLRDVQVLTPMHRGDAGAAALNEALQTALNPSAPVATRGGRTFRVGDKVMQLRNDYEKEV